MEILFNFKQFHQLTNLLIEPITNYHHRHHRIRRHLIHR